ncbi:hypothetical protein SAMN06264364_10531 [Quadrisphaera granulorum]|uniref:Uncharacterized protein n=1 Tax=Quadrisphaera granulorum TaxID=317664 RepID=A0A316AX99_9ACTN|nr:hypothetical protein [Quadrisphaera granulorum]PWJ54827.1 hypothetical protein BXY45_10531 [Quadrisphaera granulorum]SZE95773.1 hypothetical protein SAMN06264364_10531 [Quadrisphaera granulorum]
MSPSRGASERVYAALLPHELATSLRDGHLPATAPVHAVTPALREHYTEGDAEELELAAMLDAADSCLRLLAAGTGTGTGTGVGVARRLVLAADVPAAQVRVRTVRDDDPPEALSLVELGAPLPLAAVVSAHVDEPEAAADVAAAAAALPAADSGDDDATFTVDGAQGHDLLWYDSSELAQLADELG